MIFIRSQRRVMTGFVASLLLASLLPAAAAADDLAFRLDPEYRDKVVVVDFWASWCAPCRRSLPWLDAMQRRYAGEGLVVIGVNEDKTREDAEAFLAEVPVGFRIVLDLDGEIARQYELMAMPSTYVYGRDGQLVTRHLGFKVANQDEYEALLRSVLEDNRAAANDHE